MTQGPLDTPVRPPIDGRPVGIKDMLETIDMLTAMGVRGLAGHFPKRAPSVLPSRPSITPPPPAGDPIPPCDAVIARR